MLLIGLAFTLTGFEYGIFSSSQRLIRRVLRRKSGLYQMDLVLKSQVLGAH